ncbi:hypothetical protein PFICI_08515 [Pestalotiopsis fici W106-1]|uniref:RNase III domain-containing protein n=1 Tax=Pestalotiopsis fici (strain W106-1 / CGMCC3.15140) TaxID=1229662 RepID=W3WZV0_PESFW|nr:uncharacterized protein PFICI_08515 [Pestalotiopsis fici W106-1]ETS78662.1 hypothetical protein PFICI_08515 [Pestalotiopsis fici W106-1]
MSKRQFSDFALPESSTSEDVLGSVSQIVQQAQDLLRAAQSLKQDIQDGKQHRYIEGGSRLRAITADIANNIEKLNAQPSAPPSKAPKLQDVSAAPVRIPHAIDLTPWTPHDDAKARPLPSLPTIRNTTLESAVFTHAGLSKDPTGSYERLEWIGDAYLYLMSSAFIYQTFPQLPAGRCSQYRELLIRNKTLGKYTQQYELNKRLKLPPEFRGQNDMAPATKKLYGKVLGDVFEAYIAGIILGDPQHGLSSAASWIKVLWRGELEEELHKEFRERQERPPIVTTVAPLMANRPKSESSTATSTDAPPKPLAPPKVRLSQALGGKDVLIEYRDQGEPKTEKKTGLPWYTVGVYLHGWGVKDFNMGYGSALNKKEAGSKAAQMALDNKKMISRFAQRKKDFDAAVQAQRG